MEMVEHTETPARTRKLPRTRLRWPRLALAGLAGIGLAMVLAWVWTSEPVEIWRMDRTSTADLEQFVRTHPAAPWPAYVLGSRYAAQNRMEEAMDLFERARNLAPGSFRTHFSMGRGFMRLGAFPLAVESLQRAAQLAPREARTHLYLGVALRAMGRFREAAAAGARSTELDPRKAEAWYELGVTYYRPTGMPGEGLRCFQRAVELKPDTVIYQRAYADTLVSVGEYAKAEQHAREAVRLDPKDATARYLLGKILHRGDAAGVRREEAGRELREAIALVPSGFQPHYELGLLLEESGDYAAALKEFETSARLHPSHEQSWFHLGNAAARLGRGKQAAGARRRFTLLTRDRDERQYLERRVFDYPEDAALRMRFAAILERAGQWREAAAQYGEVLRQQPQHRAARAALAALEKRARQAARPPSGPASP
jgi:tetratricopeptide (TPR) repeat protein